MIKYQQEETNYQQPTLKCILKFAFRSYILKQLPLSQREEKMGISALIDLFFLFHQMKKDPAMTELPLSHSEGKKKEKEARELPNEL